MRTGAIFARGSCRALKMWMALAGMVLAILTASSGTALAQTQTLTEVTASISGPRTIGEGDEATYTVKVTGKISGRDQTGDPPDNLTSTERTVTVMVDVATAEEESGTTGEFNEAGQPNDGAIITNARLQLTLDANTGTTARERTATGEVTFRTNPDNDAEDEVVFLRLESVSGGTLDGNGGVGNTAKFTIEDAQTQTYELSLNTVTHTGINPPKENAAISVNLKAKPAHHDDGALITLYVDGEDGKAASGYAALGESSTTGSSVAAIGTLDPDTNNTNALATAVNTRAITISQDHSADNGDGNRVTDTITLRAFEGAGRSSTQADTLAIDVRDEHGLPAAGAITAVAKNEDGDEIMEIVEGGDPVFLTVTVDRGRGTFITDEALEVEIRPADPMQVTDYDLTGGRFTLEERTSGKQTNDRDDEIKLSARSDDGDVGSEDLVLSLVVSGSNSQAGSETSIGTFSIPITDATTPLISVKDNAYDAIMAKRGGDDEPLNPGDSFSVMTADMFDFDDAAVTVAVGISVEGPSVTASASSEVITISAVAAGESKVTVTANASPKASSFTANQTEADSAQITFPVNVVLVDLAYSIMGPDDMNLAEGDSAMVKVMASRALDGDETAEIMLMRDGSSSATMDDFEVMPEMVTLMAGDMEAEFTVTAVEDGMDENEAEMLTLFLVVDGMQMSDMSVSFYLWDAAVPALPIIAQLLLAAFLAIGGYRRYLRR